MPRHKALRKFKPFPRLPLEIQAMVWELASPERLFILMPYPRRPRTETDADHYGRCWWDRSGVEHKPPQYVWVVHPRWARIPPLLHVCHASRAWMLRNYYEPVQNESRVWFTAPFISYDHDLIAICPRNPRAFRRRGRRARNKGNIPQLLGLDALRVRHAAWFQAALRPPYGCYFYANSHLRMLPHLETLTLVETEYQPRRAGGQLHPGEAFKTWLSQDEPPSCDPFQLENQCKHEFWLVDVPINVDQEAVGLVGCQFLTHNRNQDGSIEEVSTRARRRLQDYAATTYMARLWLWHMANPQGETSLAHGNGVMANAESYQISGETFLLKQCQSTYDDEHCTFCYIPDVDADSDSETIDVTFFGNRASRVHTWGDVKHYTPPFKLRYALMCESEKVQTMVEHNGFRTAYADTEITNAVLGPPQHMFW